MVSEKHRWNYQKSWGEEGNLGKIDSFWGWRQFAGFIAIEFFKINFITVDSCWHNSYYFWKIIYKLLESIPGIKKHFFKGQNRIVLAFSILWFSQCYLNLIFVIQYLSIHVNGRFSANFWYINILINFFKETKWNKAIWQNKPFL